MVPDAMALDPEEYPKLETFIDEMVEKHQYDREQLLYWFERTELKQSIIDAINAPGEAKPWHQYRDNFITPRNIRRGLRFWEKNREALERAKKKYGIPPEIILGVIGVETQYGINKGRYRTIDALTTLTLLYPRRATLFRKELAQFFLLTKEMDLDPMRLKSSYAGAMGYPQFLPSSYRSYAVDFDGDDERDLIDNPTDAIGSVANYFKVHGWKKNEPIVDDTYVKGKLHNWFNHMEYKPTMPVGDFVDYGVSPRNYMDMDRPASLHRFRQKNGIIYRFGFHNFYVITRYNNSRNYAMAVYELGAKLKKRFKELQ